MTTRNVVLISALVGFVSGLGGANVQPILTGAGKIVFPENATPANILASSGELDLNAGGSNKDVVCVPTGTGVCRAPIVAGGTGTTSTLTLRTTTGVGAAGADLIFQGGNNGATEFARILNSGFFGIGVSSPQSLFHVASASTAAGTDDFPAQLQNPNTAANARVGLALHTNAATTVAGAGIEATNNGVDGGAHVLIGPIVGGAFTEHFRFFSTGGLSAGSTTDPGAGVINAANGYSSGGTAGVGAASNITVCTSGACATSCTLQFTKGIRTGGSCPI